jgi:Xaa-Pro dipeptidase
MSVAFSDGEFERRATLARQALAESRADALLVDHAELMSWLSGYTVSETMYRSLVLPLEGEPWFVLRELDAAPCGPVRMRTKSTRFCVGDCWRVD